MNLPRLDLSDARPAKPARVRAKKPATSTHRRPSLARVLSRFKLGMTVALGMGIPLLSLAMSKLAGTLAAAQMYALAAFALCLMIAVLGVSLSHLAWAIENIASSLPWLSWALAIALDLSLVLCELCHVYASNLGLEGVTIAVMACVAVTSMALNVYAFLMHK